MAEHGGHVNGKSGAAGAHLSAASPPPERVVELAAACVRFVERALGVRLDYEPETLSVLDHYVESARHEAAAKPEALAVVAHAAGAYFGEVVRRRHRAWWRAEAADDPASYRLEFEEVYLSFSPVALVSDALHRGASDAADASDAGELGGVEIEEADQEAVKARLADLPDVSEEEYYALSTRLEVIDITVEAIRARRLAAGEPVDAALRPDDYDDG
ncbi:MAG TPA: DUF6278 family protein [Minicystis sp.]|nr:DUF6278 family protein [Minicystis sp.]